MALDNLAHKFSGEIYKYIKNWMKVSYGEDLEFHYYKMKLMESMYDSQTAVERVKFLISKIETEHEFDLIESMSDKLMGENVAKYILSIVMMSLNNEYLKLLEFETDRVKSENNNLLNKSFNLKNKLASH